MVVPVGRNWFQIARSKIIVMRMKTTVSLPKYLVRPELKTRSKLFPQPKMLFRRNYTTNKLKQETIKIQIFQNHKKKSW